MSTQIRIVPLVLPIDAPDSASFGLHLCQIEYELNPATRRLKDQESQWRRIAEIVKGTAWSSDSSSILVLPECSLPSEHVSEFCDLVLDSAPPGTLVIAGLETLSLSSLVALASRLKWVLPSEMNAQKDANIPANVALVCARSAGDPASCSRS